MPVRFKVLGITYGGDCIALYINPTVGYGDRQVQSRDGTPTHPYYAECVIACPHCTKPSSYNRLRKLSRLCKEARSGKSHRYQTLSRVKVVTMGMLK